MNQLVRSKSKARVRATSALCLFTVLALLAAPSFGQDDEASVSPPPGSIEFVGRNMLGKANGIFHEWRVTHIDIDRENPAASEVQVEVDIASIDTGIGLRDRHLRSGDFFDVEAFPKATVRVHDAVSKGKSDRGLPLYDAQFTLRIRDTEKTIPGEFELTSEDPLTVEGNLVLNRTEFGVGGGQSSWNPMSVREDVPIHFVASLSAP